MYSKRIESESVTIEIAKGLDKITDAVNKAFDVERLPFRRNLTQEDINKLQKACSLAFKSEIHPEVIEKIMHYCYYVERQIKGRAAGNIEDLIIRYLMRYFASFLEKSGDGRPCHLEIGALFGAATIFSCHAVKFAEKEIVTVVIDPFEGYYEQDVDVVTKKRVDEETFWSNIDRCDFPRDMVEVMKGLSTDEDIIKRSKELRILSLLIDGDHSYDGVKKDWMNFSPQVVTGGHVLFDDYNNNAWPDVTEFVNKEVLSNSLGKWEVILVYGNSLIVKRTNLEKGKGFTPTEICYQRLNDRQRTLEQKKREIEQMQKEIEQMHKEIEKRDRQIHMMQNWWRWKITAALRRLVR